MKTNCELSGQAARAQTLSSGPAPDGVTGDRMADSRERDGPSTPHELGDAPQPAPSTTVTANSSSLPGEPRQKPTRRVTPRSLRRADVACFRTLCQLQKAYAFRLAYDKKLRGLFANLQKANVTREEEDAATRLYLENLFNLRSLRFDFFAKTATTTNAETADVANRGRLGHVTDPLITAAIVENYAQMRLWGGAPRLAHCDVMTLEKVPCSA